MAEAADLPFLELGGDGDRLERETGMQAKLEQILIDARKQTMQRVVPLPMLVAFGHQPVA
jgi:hypothetical protein